MCTVEVVKNLDACALCLRPSDLKNSHLVPKAAYRVIGKSKKQRQSPILIRTERRQASATDRQYTKKLLCGECEQRFSQREDLVSKYWYRKPGFLMKNQLRALKIFNEIDGQRFYDSYPPIGLCEDDLFYFALSIFWRACQGDWGDYKGLGSVPLDIEEMVRLYLVGEHRAPSAVKVRVYADWRGLIQELMTFPASGKNSSWWVILGLLIVVDFDPLQTNSFLNPIWAPGQAVSLVLDEKRCRETLIYVREIAISTQSANK